jgi:transcriptional regulator with XRE-family HTH domain
MLNLLNFKERLLYVMDKKGVNASELARLTDMHPSQISRYINGVTPIPSRATTAKIANKLRVNSRWLEDGTGSIWEDDILPKTSIDSIAALAIATTQINSILSQLIETRSHDLKLPETVKASLLQRLEQEYRVVKQILQQTL